MRLLRLFRAACFSIAAEVAYLIGDLIGDLLACSGDALIRFGRWLKSRFDV